MTVKCRLCNDVVLNASTTEGLQGPMGEHLRNVHRWEILRLIQGTEGDGSFARFLESLLFEVPAGTPGDAEVEYAHAQYNLWQGARSASAVAQRAPGKGGK